MIELLYQSVVLFRSTFTKVDIIRLGQRMVTNASQRLLSYQWSSQFCSCFMRMSITFWLWLMKFVKCMKTANKSRSKRKKTCRIISTFYLLINFTVRTPTVFLTKMAFIWKSPNSSLKSREIAKFQFDEIFLSKLIRQKFPEYKILENPNLRFDDMLFSLEKYESSIMEQNYEIFSDFKNLNFEAKNYFARLTPVNVSVRQF